MALASSDVSSGDPSSYRHSPWIALTFGTSSPLLTLAWGKYTSTLTASFSIWRYWFASASVGSFSGGSGSLIVNSLSLRIE